MSVINSYIFLARLNSLKVSHLKKPNIYAESFVVILNLYTKCRQDPHFEMKINYFSLRWPALHALICCDVIREITNCHAIPPFNLKVIFWIQHFYIFLNFFMIYRHRNPKPWKLLMKQKFQIKNDWMFSNSLLWQFYFPFKHVNTPRINLCLLTERLG